MKPFIARDTKKPLVVLGGYRIGEGGVIIRDTVKAREAGKDYGSDPLGNGMVRMVPSGDVVTVAEAKERLK